MGRGWWGVRACLLFRRHDGVGARAMHGTQPPADPSSLHPSPPRGPAFIAAPVYQMREYYVEGNVDDCSGHWKKLWACLRQRTRFKDEAREGRGRRLWDGHAPLPSRAHAAAQCLAWRETCGQSLSFHALGRPRPQGRIEPTPRRSETCASSASAQLQVVAVDRDSHPLWTLRTPEEAAAAWQAEFGGPQDEPHPQDPLMT